MVTLALMLVGLVCFRLVQLSVTPVHNFETALDHVIPFIPGSLAIYLSFFGFLAVGGARATPREFEVILFATMLALIIAFLCFSLVPAAVTRPDVSVIESEFLRRRFTRMRGVDDAHNSFPSLHVAITWVFLEGYRNKRGVGLAVVAAVLISVSTLTVKQHCVADVVGGMVLGWCAVAVARWRLTAWAASCSS